MQKRKLGRTDMTVSASASEGSRSRGFPFDEADRILKTAIERGINFFDSARAYTDSEEKMGRALAGARDGIYLSTKSLSRTASELAEEIETSLRNLRTDTIDLYQLHSIGTLADLDTRARARRRLRSARRGARGGQDPLDRDHRPLARDHAQGDRTGLFDTAQFPFNPIETEWEEEVIPAAKAAGVGTICMKPLAGGAIRNRALALRFELTRGMDVVIPGMDAVEQVEENAAAGEKIVRAGRRGARRARGREDALGREVLPPLRLLPAVPERAQHPVSLSHRRLLHALRAQGLGARAALGASRRSSATARHAENASRNARTGSRSPT